MNSMESHTYKRVLLTTASRLLQARKRLEKILDRLKLWMSSVCDTHVFVDPQLEVQDASSGSAGPTRAALMTRHDSITCQSISINNTVNNLEVPPLSSEPPPNFPYHVRNDGDEYRDIMIPEAFSDDSKLKRVVPEYGYTHTAFQYYLPCASEEPEPCTDSATVFSWPGHAIESVDSFGYVDEVQTDDPNPLVDMLCDVSSVVIDTSQAENGDQDAQDGGLCVIITPPDDNWETSCYTAYNNRIGSQYLPFLVVPPFYQFTSRLIKYEEWTAMYHPPAETVSHGQPATPRRASAGPLVFSPRGFQKHLQDTMSERFYWCSVVTALQCYQLKAIVSPYRLFCKWRLSTAASLKACSFRMRYDTPGFLESIEPQFKWVDPAEILIESFRHTPQIVTIYTSHRPCSVPHIVIHDSPPNDPYVVWSNSTDSQNYYLLTISSPNPSLREDKFQLANDWLTDTSSSLCDSSPPVTPKEFSSTFEENLNMLLSEDTYELQHINQEYEDEYVTLQYSGPNTTFLSKSKFFIPDDEEEEDSLPPLDDWYISIAKRCMSPEEAEGVAMAAACRVVE